MQQDKNLANKTTSTPGFYSKVQPVTAKKESFATQQVAPTAQKVFRKVQLYDDDRNRHLFPLFKDGEVGIPTKYQDIVWESWNDDDRRTSTTQMERGMKQTMEDLYGILRDNRDRADRQGSGQSRTSGNSSNYMTQ